MTPDLRKVNVNLSTILLLLWTGAWSSAAVAQQAAPDIMDARGHHFVAKSGNALFSKKAPFRVAGASNYYPMYASQFMVDDLLTRAAANSFNVVRFWGSLDIGNQDGSNSVDGIHNGVYFQYWNGTQPAFNDGASGLQHLDYVIYKAGQLNLHVIIPFVNNWSAFGGMDQYVRWAGGQFHDQFYTDATVRTYYHAWISHLLNHVNVYTGVAYRNDATIMEWELANEPRCGGSNSGGLYPQSGTCTTQTLTTWADEVSTFVKSVDHKHLLSAGDEGFYCISGSPDWTMNCSQGVDTIALASLPNMDTMSFHLYPDYWGKDATWAQQWIAQHILDSHKLDQRAILGEFGWLNKSTRNPIYQQWTNTVLKDKGAGALYWILSGEQDGGTLYPDFDGFTVYCPSPVCLAFTNFAQRIEGHKPLSYAPVADDDSAVTQHDTAVTLQLTTNDITYGHKLAMDSIDLDPATPGRQTQFTTAFGTFVVQSAGAVQFMPALGFSGKATATYTINDTSGLTSNAANIVVDVKGNPSILYTFEDGTDTWAAANFNSTAGTVAQSALFPTDGTHSLAITGVNGGWFNPTFAAPIPLANIHHIFLDITTTGAGTSQSVALQVGPNWTWCQTNFGFINSNTSTTVDVDLGALFSSCNPPDSSVLQNINVFYSGGGTYYMDNVRTQ